MAPNRSLSTDGRSDLLRSIGMSMRAERRGRSVALTWGPRLVVVVAPVLGEHVIDDVVDRDGTKKVVVLVDDGQGHEVVRREVAGHLPQRCEGPDGLQVLVDQ